jgi:hypothetical protein
MRLSGTFALDTPGQSGLTKVVQAMVSLGWDIENSSPIFVRATRKDLLRGNVEVQVVVSDSTASYDAEMPHKGGPFVRHAIEAAVADLRKALEPVGVPAPSLHPATPGGQVGPPPVLDETDPRLDPAIYSLAPGQAPELTRPWPVSMDQTPLPSGSVPIVPASTPPIDLGDARHAPGNPGDKRLHEIIARAVHIDRQHLKYELGGGHRANWHHDGIPLDCSGAVSKVLGVTPRVSGEFERYGEAGPGKHVTIYANADHVLMEINGHFWGTSHSNPHGGPGWIQRSYISAGYLAGFTARHPVGE